jgi:hypothetical protein
MKCTMKKHSSALLFLILMATGLHGQDNFSGIFHATDAEYRYAEGVTFEQLLRQKQEYDTSGFLLKEVETFGQTKNRRFWAAWEKTPGESRIEEIFRACLDFHDRAKASKFCFRRGKFCSRMRAIRRKI